MVAGGKISKKVRQLHQFVRLTVMGDGPEENAAVDHLGNCQKAVECFRKAVELEPGDKAFQRNLEIAKEEL